MINKLSTVSVSKAAAIAPTVITAPEREGMNYWLYDSKLNLEDIAKSFFDQPETQEQYPNRFSNLDFIITIYNNIFNRDPDQEGSDYWLKELNDGNIEKDFFILAIINSARGDDLAMLEKQTEVGIKFANTGIQSLDMANQVIEDIR